MTDYKKFGILVTAILLTVITFMYFDSQRQKFLFHTFRSGSDNTNKAYQQQKECPPQSECPPQKECPPSSDNSPTAQLKHMQCSSSSLPLQAEIAMWRTVPREFSQTEQTNIAECRKRNLQSEHKRSWDTFFANQVEYIRWNNHTYLNGDSTVIEVGGNMGVFTENLQRLFKPRRYIVLEPISVFYDHLRRKFQNMTNIVFLNFGIGKEDKIDMVKVDGGSTSKYLPNRVPKSQLVPLRQINATTFFTSMAIGFYEIDLLTVNCEGCEYDILDSILDSNMVQYFRHIQISFHHFKGLGDTLKRYCEYQEILKRTHRVVYQYSMFWESWTRKDLSQ